MGSLTFLVNKLELEFKVVLACKRVSAEKNNVQTTIVMMQTYTKNMCYIMRVLSQQHDNLCRCI